MKTIKLFDIRDAHGDVIGSFVKDISAREILDMKIMRKLFNDSLKDSSSIFRMPIFEDGTIALFDSSTHPNLTK